MERLWIVAIGGLLPAFGFGLAAVFQKGATLHGVQVGTYMFYAGVVLAAGGLLMRQFFGETGWAPSGALLAMLGGLGLALGNGGLSYAILKLNAPVALITPINVLGTLITVITGFAVFREYEGISALRLVAGALLVMAGAALVATS